MQETIDHCRRKLLIPLTPIASKQHSSLILRNELIHDKTSKMTVRPAKLRSAWASTQSDQSLRCPNEETFGP